MSGYKIFGIYYMGGSYDGDQWTKEECDSKPESKPEVFEIRKDGKEVASRTDFDEAKFICDRLNACDRIPSDQLGEVKKAWVMLLLLKSRYTADYYFLLGQTQNGDELEQLIGMAKADRKNGKDFGPELNALIDSVKE